jgi:high-affinity Fe2+/Pb2+ permease
MGANPTQAQAVALFLVAFTLIAGGFAGNIGWIYMILGLLVLAISIMLFLKAKPWEHNEE